uniref:Uncharacterized protein n=1 Tax=Megaviridae environmental sample TaxID=1737588 RepID=A0A5J6VIZ6_9VIRU|nr:MAG: hypothetical protein [Megaviridae environmental sample]
MTEEKTIIRQTKSTYELLEELQKAYNPLVPNTLEKYMKRYAGETVIMGNHTHTQVFHQHPNLESLFKEKPLKRIFGDNASDYARMIENETKTIMKKMKKKDKMRRDNLIRQTQTKQASIIATYKNTNAVQLNQINIPELLITYFMIRAYKSHKNTPTPAHLYDSIMSLIQCMARYENNCHDVFKQACAEMRDKIMQWDEIDMHTMITQYSHLIINSTFKRSYAGAFTPFPEQAMVMQSIVRATPSTPDNDQPILIGLPSGTGTGKTALVPVISRWYGRRNKMVIYCAPMNPVRTDVSSYLVSSGIRVGFCSYECGLENNTERYKIQYHYNCSGTDSPQVVVCDMQALLKLLEISWDVNLKQQVTNSLLVPGKRDRTIDAPPCSFTWGSHGGSRRFEGIPKEYMFSFTPEDIVVIMDEPPADDPILLRIFELLPKQSFVFSATSTGALTPHHQEIFAEHWGGELEMIESSTLGVCAQMISHYTNEPQIIGPHTGCTTREELSAVLQKLEKVTMLRFMAPRIVVQIGERMGKNLDEEFDLLEMNFEDIPRKGLAWLHELVEMKDSEIERVCNYHDDDECKDDDHDDDECKDDDHDDDECKDDDDDECKDDDDDECKDHADANYNDANHDDDDNMIGILNTNSHKFMGGALIAMTDYQGFKDACVCVLNDEVPSSSDVIAIRQQNDENQMKFDIMISKLTKEQREQQSDTRVARRDVINPQLVINSLAYLRANNRTANRNLCTLPLNEEWDPIDGLDETDERLRMIGIGRINENREFYIRSMLHLQERKVAYVGVNASGAFGLNLSVMHVIFNDLAHGMPQEQMIQLAGRVGRMNQHSQGYVHLYQREHFDNIMM